MKEIEKQDRVRVVGLFPDVVTHESAIAKVAELAKKGGGYVCFSTVHMAMESYDDPAFAKIVNGADLIVTDGMPIVWMQRLQGKKAASRVRANDLMIMLCAFCERNDLSVGFYGGRPEVIDQIRARAKRFPETARRLRVFAAVSGFERRGRYRYCRRN